MLLYTALQGSKSHKTRPILVIMDETAKCVFVYERGRCMFKRHECTRAVSKVRGLALDGGGDCYAKL